MVKQLKKTERGNVLFLILIAVALFAALSYAVTQSSRSGGSDASSETAAVNSASLTQYPTGIRTAMLRMSIAGVPVDTMEFNEPEDFGDCTQPSGGPVGGACVFHPNGGGAVHQYAPQNAGVTGGPLPWYYNDNFAITDVGTSATEMIAFLPDVTEGLCRELNRRYSIDGIPAYGALPASIEETIAQGTGQTYYVASGTGTATTVAWPTGTHLLVGQPYGCFDSSGRYVYYHTIVEN